MRDNHLLRYALAIGLIGPLFFGTAMSAGYLDAPPLAPPSSEKAADDPEFKAECMKHLGSLAEGMKWEVGPPLLTRSDVYGLVLRLDATTLQGPERRRFITRLVCWKAPGTEGFNLQVSVTDEPPLTVQQK